MKETIICAAIYYDNGNDYAHQPKNIESGLVIAGRRHHNCFATVYNLIGARMESMNEIQGFLTNLDRFVDREEGLKIALAADQVKNVAGIRGNRLYSEDIY